MTCARCGLDLTAVTAAYCPRCGEPLPYASLAPSSTPSPFAPPNPPAYPGYTSHPLYPQAPSSGFDNPAWPSSPLYGAPPADPTYPSAYPPAYPPGAFAPPSSPLYGAPATGEPAYPPATNPAAPYPPPYGAYGAYGAYGEYGPYGAAAQNSTPMYQPGSTPYYGQSVPPSMPMYAPSGGAWPGYAPPQPKRRFGRLLSTIVFVAILLCVVAGVALSKYAPSTGSSGASNTAGAPAGMHFILRDSMLGTNDGWSTDSHCFFSSDGYHVKDAYICYAPSGDFLNGNVSVTTKQAFGSIHYYYGIVFRRVSKGNYYSFGVDSNGYWAFIKVVNTKASFVGAQHSSAAIKTGIGASNTLDLHASGTHFAFFVNGTQLGQADDSTYSTGKVGVDGGGGGIETVFTNFTVAVPN